MNLISWDTYVEKGTWAQLLDKKKMKEPHSHCYPFPCLHGPQSEEEEGGGSTWQQAGSVRTSALRVFWDHLLHALTAALAWLKGTVFLSS